MCILNLYNTYTYIYIIICIIYTNKCVYYRRGCFDFLFEINCGRVHEKGP